MIRLASPYTAQSRIDSLALLGLRDSSDPVERRAIRAAQLEGGNPFGLLVLLGTNILAAIVVSMMLDPLFPNWKFALWGAAVTTASGWVVFHRLYPRDHLVGGSREEVRSTIPDGVALGVAWAIAPIWFGPDTPGYAGIGLWVVLAILMTSSAIAMATLPLATIIFLGVLGGVSTIALGLISGPAAAGAAALFTLLLMAICFARGHALVLIRKNEIAILDREQTVSLLLREFEEHGADWLWEVDTERRIVRASARFAGALGLDPIALNGMPLLRVLAGPQWETGDFPPALHQLAERLKAREAFRDLPLPVIVNGEKRWWQITASPRRDETGAFTGFRGVASDVTELRASTDRIQRMARYDTLTGLPNRLFINEALAQAMAEADKWRTKCAFMMIDLDRFKSINDSLGHPVGDRLLGRVAERLRQLITDNEVIGRLGGDEFAVVVRDASDTDRVEELARTIISRLSRAYEVDEHTLYIGASIGLAIAPRDGSTAETLVRSADLALYRSKDQGGGTFHAYEPQLHHEAEERRVLEIALRGALQNDELHLVYQPVVDARDGALIGFEALLRWTHPTMGPINPAKFIPIAEEARLIAPIGEWVLRHACAEAARWNGDIRLAVNVSAEQLHNPAFVSVVAQALSQSGLSADRLELEVTESVFMREGTGAVKVLERLIDLGCRLSLDDFGTGYSSLGYLSRTRFSTIKIERGFVQSAATGERAAIAIIRAVVALADSLGMTTTAEGVESATEHEMVRVLGCDTVQGYHFGRPLPVSEARVLATRRRDDRERIVAA